MTKDDRQICGGLRESPIDISVFDKINTICVSLHLQCYATLVCLTKTDRTECMWAEVRPQTLVAAARPYRREPPPLSRSVARNKRVLATARRSGRSDSQPAKSLLLSQRYCPSRPLNLFSLNKIKQLFCWATRRKTQLEQCRKSVRSLVMLS